MAYATTMLLWGLLRYSDAYDASGQKEAMLDSVKWPLDYFIKAHDQPDELYAQVSDMVDHCFWRVRWYLLGSQIAIQSQ